MNKNDNVIRVWNGTNIARATHWYFDGDEWLFCVNGPITENEMFCLNDGENPPPVIPTDSLEGLVDKDPPTLLEQLRKQLKVLADAAFVGQNMTPKLRAEATVKMQEWADELVGSAHSCFDVVPRGDSSDPYSLTFDIVPANRL